MFESPWHWAVVALVAFLLFFGWKQLPDMARSLGRSMRVFKTEIKGMGEDDKARDGARDQTGAAGNDNAPQKALEARRVAPSPSPRPRPAPSPNGRAETAAKAE